MAVDVIWHKWHRFAIFQAQGGILHKFCTVTFTTYEFWIQITFDIDSVEIASNDIQWSANFLDIEKLVKIPTVPFS